VKDDATNDKTIVAPAHGHTNLLNPTLGTTTVNGVTCTNNGDGTYTLSGTATGWVTLDACTVDVVEGVLYRLVGCPSGGSGSTYRTGLYTNESSPTSIIQDLGAGRNWLSDRTATIKYRIVIPPNYTISSPLVFKPMLTTDLSVDYDDFVAYSGDGELNENVAALYEGLESTDANLADVQSQIVTSGNIENGNTATSAHTVGTYIQWKGKFYVVTAAIAAGDTLAVGTNLAAKTVGDVLTQINADLTTQHTITPIIVGKWGNYNVKRVSFSGSLTFPAGDGRHVATADLSSILTRNTRPISVKGFYNYTDTVSREQIITIGSTNMNADGLVTDASLLRSIDRNNGYVLSFETYTSDSTSQFSGHYDATIDYIDMN
jgi:hypothetical protein